MRPKKCHYLDTWRISLIAQHKVENESLQKLCYEMDQMFIEQDLVIEAEHQDLIIVGGNDEEEMVTLELIP